MSIDRARILLKLCLYLLDGYFSRKLCYSTKGLLGESICTLTSEIATAGIGFRESNSDYSSFSEQDFREPGPGWFWAPGRDFTTLHAEHWDLGHKHIFGLLQFLSSIIKICDLLWLKCWFSVIQKQIFLLHYLGHCSVKDKM